MQPQQNAVGIKSTRVFCIRHERLGVALVSIARAIESHLMKHAMSCLTRQVDRFIEA